MSDYKTKNFSLRSRIIAWVSRRLQNFEYTSRQGLTKGLKRRGGLGFVPEWIAGQPSVQEIKFLKGLDLKGKVVYDIGGYQGLMTLFFARTAAQVITYEANPYSVVRIMDNVKLNGFKNVLVRTTAVGSRELLLGLYFDPLMSGAASGDPEIVNQMINSGQVQHVLVPTVAVDADINRYMLAEPDFIKIDVEGMELDVLMGLQCTMDRSSPALYIELHGATPEDKLNNATAVIEYLRLNHYDVYSVELDRPVLKVTGKESHIYCTHRKDKNV